MKEKQDSFDESPVTYNRRFNAKAGEKAANSDLPISKARGGHAAYSRRKPVPAKAKVETVREVLDHRKLPG